MKFDVYGVFEVRKYLGTIEAEDEFSATENEEFDGAELENLDNCQVELQYLDMEREAK